MHERGDWGVKNSLSDPETADEGNNQKKKKKFSRKKKKKEKKRDNHDYVTK